MVLPLRSSNFFTSSCAMSTCGSFWNTAAMLGLRVPVGHVGELFLRVGLHGADGTNSEQRGCTKFGKAGGGLHHGGTPVGWWRRNEGTTKGKAKRFCGGGRRFQGSALECSAWPV